MSDQLFDWPGAEQRWSQPESAVPVETLTVKLRPPWILLGRSKTRPCAHLPNLGHPDPLEGSRFARCDDKKPAGRLLKVEGEPVVPACPDCYLTAARNGLL